MDPRPDYVMNMKLIINPSSGWCARDIVCNPNVLYLRHWLTNTQSINNHMPGNGIFRGRFLMNFQLPARLRQCRLYRPHTHGICYIINQELTFLEFAKQAQQSFSVRSCCCGFVLVVFPMKTNYYFVDIIWFSKSGSRVNWNIYLPMNVISKT